jgi:hypothetical protein
VTNPSDETTIEELLEQKAKLQDELRSLDQAIRHRRKEHRQSSAPGTSRGRPVREAVLDVLDEFDCLAHSREITLYAQARYGRAISPTRFGTLSSDEQAAVRTGNPREVHLCHGLTSERFEAIKRLWGRSDWPPWKRIVAPTTGRVQHLAVTAKLCELALTNESAADDAEMMKYIAADHARDLPGVKVTRGGFDLSTWRDIATTELAKWAARDQELREAAAERLLDSKYDELVRLFGVPETVLPAVAADRKRDAAARGE